MDPDKIIDLRRRLADIASSDMEKLCIAAQRELEQDAHDTIVDAVNRVIDMGLSAATITGLLYLALRRLSEEADTW